jgi:hypothetical protein
MEYLGDTEMESVIILRYFRLNLILHLSEKLYLDTSKN